MWLHASQLARSGKWKIVKDLRGKLRLDERQISVSQTAAFSLSPPHGARMPPNGPRIAGRRLSEGGARTCRRRRPARDRPRSVALSAAPQGCDRDGFGKRVDSFALAERAGNGPVDRFVDSRIRHCRCLPSGACVTHRYSAALDDHVATGMILERYGRTSFIRRVVLPHARWRMRRCRQPLSVDLCE